MIFVNLSEMRRIAVAILFMLYTGLYAVGLPLTVHYCSGNFAGFFISDGESCCSDDTHSAPDDCCETEFTYVKGENSHQSVPQVQTPQQNFIILSQGFLSLNTQTFHQSVLIHNYSYGKAGPPITDVQSALCIFRI